MSEQPVSGKADAAQTPDAVTGTLLDIEEMRYELAGTYLNVVIALQICQLRASRGWTQEELARRCGWQQPRIAQLEKTRWDHEPRVETLRTVAKAFDVTLKISFEEWGSLVSEFMSRCEIPTPSDFARDPVFQSANAAEPLESGEESGE